MRKISELITPGITDRDSAEELIIKVLDAIIERQNKMVKFLIDVQGNRFFDDNVVRTALDDIEKIDIS